MEIVVDSLRGVPVQRGAKSRQHCRIESVEEFLEAKAASLHHVGEFVGLHVPAPGKSPRRQVRELSVQPTAFRLRKEPTWPPGHVPVAREDVVVDPPLAEGPPPTHRMLSLPVVTEEIVEQTEVDEHGFEESLTVGTEARARPGLNVAPARLKMAELLQHHSDLVLNVLRGEAVEVRGSGVPSRSHLSHHGGWVRVSVELRDEPPRIVFEEADAVQTEHCGRG